MSNSSCPLYGQASEINCEIGFHNRKHGDTENNFFYSKNKWILLLTKFNEHIKHFLYYPFKLGCGLNVKTVVTT